MCPADEITALIEEAYAQEDAGDYKKMEMAAELLVAKGEKRFGKNNSNTALCLGVLAAAKTALGRYDEAEPLFLRSLKILENELGQNHPETATALNDLGILYSYQSRFEEAEHLCLRSLKIKQSKLGEDHPDTAKPLSALANLYVSQGRYDEAEPVLLQSLKIREKESGPDHPDTARALNGLAGLYSSQSRYDEAEPLFRRSLEIRETHLGTNHPDTATSLNELGVLYYRLGRYDESEALHLRSVAINEKQLGEEHLNTDISRSNLASLYISRQRYAEAETLYRRSLKIRETQLGRDHTDTAAALNNLAHALHCQGRDDEAEPLLRRSVEIFEKHFGEDHPSTAICLSNLANICDFLGRHDDAESLYLRSFEIREKQLGQEHPDTGDALELLARFFLINERPEEALPFLELLIQSRAAQWDRMLSYFSERECFAFREKEPPFRIPGSSNSGLHSSEAQLRFKGATIEAMNSRRNGEARINQSHEGREILRERLLLTARYQKALLTSGSYDPATITLQTQVEDIDKQISTLLREDSGKTKITSVGLDKVCLALSEPAVLVESFRYFALSRKEEEPRYATTLIRSSGDPIFISHGEAKSLESAITRYRDAILAAPGDDIRSPEESATQFREAEEVLYNGILAPLEAHLKPGETVIFSPDAQWHFLPLGMLRNAAGEPFSSRYQVRYVSSGRDLVKTAPARDEAKRSALVLGNPAFRDNAPLLALAESDESSEQALIASTLRAGLAQDSGRIQFSPLPGTAREASLLATRLANSGYEVTSLTGEKATEPALMKAIQGHSIVHLATHGFYLNEIKDDTKDAGPQLSDLEERKPNLASIQNPMYRSGLALSGAQSTFNLWQNGQVPPPSRDGVLLAAEMATLDLRGTDLVVLSACETAAGEALDGEGVIGLRRALNAAGATNVIMTLWPVDDEATVELMEVFYEKYLAGMPAGKALAETQRELFPKWIELHGEVGALARLAPFICTSLGKVE